jgi:hypothetical protein
VPRLSPSNTGGYCIKKFRNHFTSSSNPIIVSSVLAFLRSMPTEVDTRHSCRGANIVIGEFSVQYVSGPPSRGDGSSQTCDTQSASN